MANPKSHGHAAEFRVVLLRIRLESLRLQSHTADRALPRMVLLDLRVHQAGVDHLLLAGNGLS